MTSKPTAKGAVGRPSSKGSALGATPMTKTSSSSSATGSKSKSSAAASSTSASSSGNGSGSSHASHPVQPYRILDIGRSDGVGYSTQQINDASRSAQPVSDALDDSHEFMRSWTVKLGKAIKYNLGATSSSSTAADPTNYLVRLPAGYSLHVRPGKTKDRDGPLVFGHPLGPLAAFRSPAELALHLLWLLSGSNERADCSCRLCVRMVSEHLAAQAAQAQAAQAQAQAQATAAAASASVPASSATAVAPPAKQSPRGSTVTPIPVPVIPAAPAKSATPVPVPAAGPAATPAAQPHTLPAPVGGSSELFRPWELVWYQHITQQARGAWRLGIVLQLFPGIVGTEPPPATMPGPEGTVRVAPLGIRGLHPPDITIDTNALRPFLSFSVPGMRAGLDNVTYDAINWQKLAWDSQQAMQQQQTQQPPPGHYDTATLALEASKSAANQINACFSVFNPQPKVSPAQQMFGGVFLGAEQIVIGDALRIDAKPVAGDLPEYNPSTLTVEIMRVNVILIDNGELRFIGDIYRLAATGPDLPPPPPGNKNPVGQVFAEELAERNHGGAASSSGMGLGFTWYWLLREANGSRSENEVHGRFYASTRLAANLQNGDFLQRVAQQIPTGPVNGDDASIMASALNRRQQVGGFMYQGQRVNRASTIGQAMSVLLTPVAGVQEEY